MGASERPSSGAGSGGEATTTVAQPVVQERSVPDEPLLDNVLATGGALTTRGTVAIAACAGLVVMCIGYRVYLVWQKAWRRRPPEQGVVLAEFVFPDGTVEKMEEGDETKALLPVSDAACTRICACCDAMCARFDGVGGCVVGVCMCVCVCVGGLGRVGVRVGKTGERDVPKFHIHRQ